MLVYTIVMKADTTKPPLGMAFYICSTRFRRGVVNEDAIVVCSVYLSRFLRNRRRIVIYSTDQIASDSMIVHVDVRGITCYTYIVNRTYERLGWYMGIHLNASTLAEGGRLI